MQISLMLVKQIAAMGIMVLMGFAMAKKGLITGEESRVITKVLIRIIIPCSLINAFGTPFDPGKLEGMGVTAALTVVVYAAFLTGGKLLSRGKNGFTAGEVCSVIYSNSGNLIIPIVTGVLGTEYVIYTCSFMLIQNLLTWTHAQMKLGGEADLTIKKVLTNPSILAILAGVTLFVLRIELPGPLDNAIGAVGGCLGPMAMMITGILLAEADLKGALTSRRTHLVMLVRLVVYPLIVLGLLLCAGAVWDHPQKSSILMVVLLCASGPPASLIAQLAQMYGSAESRYISALTALSTVVSAVTMPVLCMVYQGLMA